MPYCTNCGMPFETTAIFCTHCGTRRAAPGGIPSKVEAPQQISEDQHPRRDMTFPEAFIRTMSELAAQWGCALATNPAQTKFLFKSKEMPTRCLIFSDSASPPARSWQREEFGDTVMMRWERFLGKITRSVNFEAILREAYIYGPPFYGIADVEGSPGLFLVDFWELSWALSATELTQELQGRYGMGLIAEPINGVELQFDNFDSIFVFRAKDRA